MLLNVLILQESPSNAYETLEYDSTLYIRIAHLKQIHTVFNDNILYTS